MVRGLGILAFCISTLVGCTDGLFTGTSGGDKKSGDDESADPPANVNGSFYLTCQFVQIAQPARPQADLGCVVKNEKSQQKIKTSDIATDFDWTVADLPPEQQMGVEVRITDYDDLNPDFHVLYSFMGSNADVVNQVARQTDIQMYVRPLPTKGDPKVAVKAFEAKVSAATEGQVLATPESSGVFGENPDASMDPSKLPRLR